MDTWKKIAFAMVLLAIVLILVQFRPLNNLLGRSAAPPVAVAPEVPTAQIEIHKAGPLAIDIHAEPSKINGIRITVDDDLRRPYWIDQGNSKRFFFEDRIVIEAGKRHTDMTTGQEYTKVPAFGLSINGQRWTDSAYRDYPRVEIIRLDAQD